MSIVDRIAGGRRSSRPGADESLWSRDGFVAQKTGTGASVTVDSAMHLDSVYACVRLISEDIGSLPLKTYERVPGGRVEATSTPTYTLLHEIPNEEMSAPDVWSLVGVHLNTWGNAFIGKSFTGGEVDGLWPMYPERMKVARVGGKKRFYYRDERGLETEYGLGDIIHVHGISLDGLVGLSPIAYARNSIASGNAGEEFAAQFYRNSATPRGVIEIPGELSEQAVGRLSKSWARDHKGILNMHKVAILEAGAKFNPISMPLQDAEFVAQQKLTVQKVARIFGVAPEMIGGESGASLTYSTVEGQTLSHLTHCLRPWLVRIEAALLRDPDLFTRGSGRYPEFLVSAMLRADSKTRAEVYEKALDPIKGWMNRQEVRGYENLPPERADSRVLTANARARVAHLLPRPAVMNGGSANGRV